ncbi:putative phage protein [Candidatus Hepatincola sp. Av]
MKTNNLINIKDLCKELLTYLANNQQGMPTKFAENITPTLQKLLSLIAELSIDGNLLANTKANLIASNSKNLELPLVNNNNTSRNQEDTLLPNKGTSKQKASLFLRDGDKDLLPEDTFGKKADAPLAKKVQNLVNKNFARENLEDKDLANQDLASKNSAPDYLAPNFNTKIVGLANTLAILWQQDLPEKILLARRGIDWLGEDSAQDEVTFLNKMVSLGELISEDKKLKHSSSKANYSKEEAKRMRNQLSGDKEFISSIYNKNHAKHESNLAKLHHLNSIIAG